MKNSFIEMLDILITTSNDTAFKFPDMSLKMKEYIKNLDRKSLISIVKEIGMIPERIEASSSAEKLYSKTSDFILARCFSDLGLPSVAVNERSNNADIIASSIHGYTLVADAKTFRLSRTAKNQKDFKISTLSKWRGSEHNYALLVGPYFQFPSTSSQIYSSALDDNVCLMSWEHILFLLENNVCENENFNLEQIWNAPSRIVRDTRIAFADRMVSHMHLIDKMVCDRISKELDEFDSFLNSCKKIITSRGLKEVNYLNSEKRIIENYTKEQAINELLKSKKISERILTVKKFINSLIKVSCI